MRTVRAVSSEDYEQERYATTLAKALAKGLKDATVGSLSTLLSSWLDLGAGTLILALLTTTHSTCCYYHLGFYATYLYSRRILSAHVCVLPRMLPSLLPLILPHHTFSAHAIQYYSVQVSSSYGTAARSR